MIYKCHHEHGGARKVPCMYGCNDIVREHLTDGTPCWCGPAIEGCAPTYPTLEEWGAAHAAWKAARPVFDPPDCPLCGKMRMEESTRPVFTFAASAFCDCGVAS